MWMTNAEAAAVLGIKRSSLYSYVSRGFLVSHKLSGMPRGHRRYYDRDEVHRLLEQRGSRQRPPDRPARP